MVPWPARPEEKPGERRPTESFGRAPAGQHGGVTNALNTSLLNLLKSPAQGAAAATTTGSARKADPLPAAALERAAGTARSVAAARNLEAGQKALAADLRAALAKAGVKLQGGIEFVVKSDGTVQTKGSDADKAAVKAFLAADVSKPGFASRIAGQAKEALALSSNIQQSAAISQAARTAKSSGSVMQLYNSLMQQTTPASVVYEVSAGSSSLTYPGSLAARA